MLGNQGASLINRLGTFEIDSSILQTQGFEIKKRFFELDGKTIMLKIFDMRNDFQRKMHAIPFFKAINGGILVFDIADRSAFDSLDEWINLMKEATKRANRNIPVILAGNKVDLDEQREVSLDQAAELVKKEEFIFKYLEISAVTGENVKEVFISISKEFLSQTRKESPDE